MLNSIILLSIDPNTVSSYKTFIELSSQLIITVIGILGFALFLFRNKFKTWKAITMMARTVNAFMEKVMPDLIQGFEKKEFLPKGSLVNWAKVVSSEYYAEAHSPLRLNEEGKKLLQESGFGKVIDDQADTFIKELEQRHPKSLLDVEDQAFYLLKEKENEQVTTRLRNFLYNHPEETINEILFVGALYLRDKYFEKHPESLKANGES